MKRCWSTLRTANITLTVGYQGVSHHAAGCNGAGCTEWRSCKAPACTLISNGLRDVCCSEGRPAALHSIFLIQSNSTSTGYPSPYPSPTPATVHPPKRSVMSLGHCTALNLSLNECLKEWMTQPSGSMGLSHLLSVPLALFDRQPASEQYLGNRKSDWWAESARLTPQRAAPTSGTRRVLAAVLSRRWGLVRISRCGEGP